MIYPQTDGERVWLVIGVVLGCVLVWIALVFG